MKKTILLITMLLFVLLFFTSQATPGTTIQGETLVRRAARSTPIDGFISGAPNYEIVNLPGRPNVIKINGANCEWNVISFPLNAYRGKEITIEFSADVRREGNSGNLIWGVNNNPTTPTGGFVSWPSVGYEMGARNGVWHNMRGKIFITPIDNFPFFYLSTWENSENTVYYISNLTINISEGDIRTPDLSLRPLKEIYADHFLIGNITEYNGANIQGKSLDLLRHHFNSVSCNAFYPRQLAPERKGGSFQFTHADNVVNTLRRNNFYIYAHLLVWHEQTPAWMFEGSRNEVIQNMTNHITTVMRHFSGRVNAWEVVAEAIKSTVTAAEARGDWRNVIRRYDNSVPGIPNLWFEKLGADYVEIAFRAARAADPNAILYYSDYVLPNDSNKAEVIRKMILDINDRYKRETGGSRNLIEGIGSQSHFNESHIDIRNERLMLDRFASLGIEIAINELDVASTRFRQKTGLDTVMSERDQIIQGRLYAQLLQLYREYSAHITRVTFWGLDDYNSWRSDGNPLLFDRNLNAKQAFHAVSDPEGFLRRHRR
jgi:endo-1,4-beta-xylanase